MAEIKKLYPGGKTKAFILTYDDGVEEDIKFVGLIEKYNLKGCFALLNKSAAFCPSAKRLDSKCAAACK